LFTHLYAYLYIHIFTCIEDRLVDLDDARNKLLKLQQMTINSPSSDLQLYLISEEKEAKNTIIYKLNIAELEIISISDEKKNLNLSNKNMKIELEKLKKKLILEQKKSKNYFIDLEKMRHNHAIELKKTLFFVRNHIETGQERRRNELLLNKDNYDINNSYNTNDNKISNNENKDRIFIRTISQDSLISNEFNNSFNDDITITDNILLSHPDPDIQVPGSHPGDHDNRVSETAEEDNISLNDEISITEGPGYPDIQSSHQDPDTR
jgi:hypothetical protein